MSNIIKKIVIEIANFYGILIFCLILEYMHYSVWRINLLWFECKTEDDIIVFGVAICYYLCYNIGRWIFKKF